MKQRVILSGFGLFLAVLLSALLTPARASAAGPSVAVGGTTLTDGQPFETQGGTVTLDQGNHTLTLENATLDYLEPIYISGDGQPFTVILKGTNTLGREDAPDNSQIPALLCQKADLTLQFEDGAALSAYSKSNHAIRVYGGSYGLTVTGKGTLTAVSGHYQCSALDVSGSVQIDGVTVNAASAGWYGIISYYGNITVNNAEMTVTNTKGEYSVYGETGVKLENADVTVNGGDYGITSNGSSDGISVIGGSLNVTAGGYGLYSYRGISFNNTDATIDAGSGQKYGVYVKNGGITMTDSTVNIASDSIIGAYCQYNPITIENSHLITNVPNGYSLYSIYGDISIQGTETYIKGQDYAGIYAVYNPGGNPSGKLSVSGGRIELNSTQGGLCADAGIEISGGVIDVNTGEASAIMSQSGLLSITGTDTRVTATNDSPDNAAIANFTDGGLYIQAYVSATNNSGKPFEGVMADGSKAITLGDGCGAYPQSVLTTSNTTYFTDAQGNPVSGRLDLCCHQWENPVFDWASDGKHCSVKLTCSIDGSHILNLNSDDYPGSIRSEVTTPATAADMGTTTYTVTFTLDNGQVFTDSLTVQDIPAIGYPKEDDSTSNKAVPNTGDNTPISVNIFLLLVSSGLFIYLICYKKKYRKYSE